MLARFSVGKLSRDTGGSNPPCSSSQTQRKRGVSGRVKERPATSISLSHPYTYDGVNLHTGGKRFTALALPICDIRVGLCGAIRTAYLFGLVVRHVFRRKYRTVQWQNPNFRAKSATPRAAWQRYIDFLTPFRPELYKYCRRLTGDVWEAEDLVQDTTVRGFGVLNHVHRTINNPRGEKVFVDLASSRLRRSEPRD